jgi:enoyl-CoA hydratase/carnithine racemase
MAEFVRVERDGTIATIRLDRPPMNALSTQVQDEIAAAAGEAGADPAIRAVVVYGGGLELALCADFRVSFIDNGPGKATFTGR